MLRRSLQIVLLLLLCGGITLARLAEAAEPGRSTPAMGESPAAPRPAVQPEPANSEPPAAAPAQPAGDAATPAQPAADAAAEPPVPKVSAPKLEDLLKPVNELSLAIDQAEKQLENAPGVQKELAALRERIESIQLKAKSAAEALRPRLEEVRAQIDKLGKPPAEGAPPEAPEVTQERDRLNALAAQIDGAIKKAALTEERAVQLASRVQHVRQGIFTRFLFWQTQTPLQPEVWRTAANQLAIAQRQAQFILGNWWSVATLRLGAFLAVLAASALAFFGLRAVRARLIRHWLAASAAATLPRYERAGNALRSTIAYALPAAAAAGVLYVGLDEAGLLYWQVERFAQAALFSFLIFVGIASLVHGVLQPERPRWRLPDLDDTAARTVCLALKGIAGIYALDFLARRVISILSLSPTASIVSAFIASLAYAALILLIVRTPLMPQAHAPGAPISRLRRLWLKAIIFGIGAVLLAAALLGFVALTRFLAGQLLMTGSGLMLVALVHFAIGGVRPQTPEGAAETIGAESTAPEELRRQRLARGTRLVLNVLLVLVAVPVILMAWGVSGSEIASSIRTVVGGFEIGGVRISLLRIFLGLILFVVLLVSTRLFQRWLAARALPRAHIEAGLANSIYTGVGYIGFAVALLAAVAYAGFDITSLAIVAGALSVGIGFGLQGIVNNFVSGLVLLVERPIKVGDWIALKDGEGYVRRISVRATEIETFDRASLIVPNSELVSQIVTNLTLRNQLGRLNIGVRISYATDPEVAQAVLQEVADNCTSILRYPPPLVVLDNLGDQAMEYTVRVYLADINRSLQAQTELRTQIVKALRKAGVDIPYSSVLLGHASGPRVAPERVLVRIKVALTSDPDAVLDALAMAARRCAGAREEPKAEVRFDNVGENALEFSVAVAIGEGETAAHVETALRTAAVKALRLHGIDLANAHAHQRALDELRAELYREAHTTGSGRLAEERHSERPAQKRPVGE